MQKIMWLFVALLIAFVPAASANQDDEVEPFTWDGKFLEVLKKVDIPVYIPSHVASSKFFSTAGAFNREQIRSK
ncbi:hypothetical protein ACFLFF_19825 [Brevibacillus reuszeri]|uniref:hypothetical protein n=1 Tax=Brevibacillus reuszeri TaxID=54915 RepID=UPI003672CBD6